MESAKTGRERSRESNFLKSPLWAHIRRLIHGGGIKKKNHRWRISIDVFDSGIWADIDQLLTAAPFPPFSFTAIQSTGYNCTHAERNNTRHTDDSKGRVLNKHTGLNCN